MSTTVIVAVGLYIALNVLVQSMLKRMADQLPKVTAMLWQFLAALVVSTVLFVIGGGGESSWLNLAIVGIGFVNALGAYCQWQAYAQSLSKSVLFMPLSAVLAAGLAALLLNERLLYYNASLVIGVVLLYGAAMLLSWRSPGIEQKIMSERWRWLGWVMAMLIVFGTAAFLIKVFTTQLVPLTTFLVYWYLGSAVGALLLLSITPKTEPLRWRGGVFAAVAGVVLLGSRAAHYWALQVAPLGLVLPFQSFGLVAVSILVGWFVFQEKRTLEPIHIIGFVIGLIGVAALVVSQL